MCNQTENYIILKPISERFNRIAKEISDEEIRSLIKSEIREQIKKIDFFGSVNEILENYLEENPNEVLALYKSSLKDKLRY